LSVLIACIGCLSVMIASPYAVSTSEAEIALRHALPHIDG
jgi:hypothetical protein